MQLLLITKKSDQKPDQVKNELLNTVTEPLSNWGYKLKEENNSSVVFSHSYFPFWTILTSLVILIGLYPKDLIFLVVIIPLALLPLVAGKREAFITFVVNESKTGSDVVIQGEASEKVIKALDEMKF